MPRTNTTALNDAISMTEVQIWPLRNSEGRVKAMASITLNGALRVNGCRIIEGSKGLFVSFPSEKKAGTDQYFPIFHPIDRSVGDRLQSEVLARYEAMAGV
jgi:stage V sporulation protein G